MTAASSALASDVAAGIPNSVTCPQGFEQRLAALFPDLLRRALFLTGNRDTANDLVQEAILKALDGRRTFRHDSNLRGWVTSIMQNLFIDNCRRHPHRPEDTLEMVAAPTCDASLGPMDILSLDDVEAALGVLTEENRRLFRLAQLERRSYREISAATGLCEQTLGTRLFRVRKRLRVELTRAYHSKLADLMSRNERR
jgi:RNA polymerase sigma-70 factor (ECF subfamily)